MVTKISTKTYKDNNVNKDKLSSLAIAENNKRIENVLILQGGGSLGAFGCGVYKELTKNKIDLDIIAGTSIGGINAAIMVGSKDEKHPEQLLEQFWLELADSYIDLDKTTLPHPSDSIFQLIEQFMPFRSYYDDLKLLSQQKIYLTNANEYERRVKQLKAFYSSAIFGNDKMFRPRWMHNNALADPEYFTPIKWTYMYDHSPLAKTLEKYIDFDKLRPKGNPNTRLILTAVNILTAESLTFDSYKQQITPKHILATSAYPLYNFPWIEVQEGIFAWDGGLLSNTPLREVLDVSPINDKKIFLVENYPKKVDALPKNLPEVHHRARDIIFSDKTEHNITLSKIITQYLRYIDELYQIIEEHIEPAKIDKQQLKRIRLKYKRYKQEHGAEIKEIFYITRKEPFPHMYENADFSPETIRNEIKEGEMKALQAIKDAIKINS
ncbi:MAG: patatin-like phospholipase family protein [Nitrososphaeraceae archaeon]